MKLALTKCNFMDDWYLIERAEHDGREWLEKTSPHGFSLRCSSRISDADVEGTASEMLKIAKAIRTRSGVSFTRCEVSFQDGRVEFCSPRNSQRPGAVTLAEADALADEIERKLAREEP